MVLCVECYGENQDKYKVEKELPKKNAKKCSMCGKLRRAIYIIEETDVKKTKKGAKAKKVAKVKKVAKPQTDELETLVQSFESTASNTGKEIAAWLKRESNTIKSIGQDYWTPQGIFWFAYQDDQLVTTFNGDTYNKDSLDSILAV